MDGMRELLGSAWAYYVAFGILIVWFAVQKGNNKR